LALAACLAHADTVWLNNGDRLTGTIQSLDGGYLLIRTDYGGQWRIDFGHVKTLQSDTPLVVRDGSMQHDYRARLAGAEAGNVMLIGLRRDSEGTEAVRADVPLARLDSVVRPRPFLRETSITGRLDMAADRRTASTDTQDYSATRRSEEHTSELQSRENVVRRYVHCHSSALLRSAGKRLLMGLRRDSEGKEAVRADVRLDRLDRVVRPRPFLRETSITRRLDMAADRRTASTDTQDYSATL